jgi:hypothetical protein
MGHSPIKMNPLSYGHCFIEIDIILESRSTTGLKGWEATFLTYAHRMVPQKWGTILFVISVFTPRILPENSPCQVMMNIGNPRKRRVWQRFRSRV